MTVKVIYMTIMDKIDMKICFADRFRLKFMHLLRSGRIQSILFMLLPLLLNFPGGIPANLRNVRLK